ncbi:hypothetical protein NC653_035098 [Populus alba x Populus x berolinensis]|uniref:Uncharacterized protein n=1 Tax=Populus alba x Populus x berolinensis TaxID=444605 RepID=A0AAD6LBN5_9ROSI|nr:hypothetical protein NC653_038959 [Populus alba x Populus x berolinensis]KAJ6970712.1 hypothetical protein NC653_035098 [Populus alba x Populus x berolinensis]
MDPYEHKVSIMLFFKCYLLQFMS